MSRGCVAHKLSWFAFPVPALHRGGKAASQTGVKPVASRKRAGIWLSLIATVLSWGSTWMWCSYIFRRLLCHMLWDCPGTHCAELRGELSWHFPSFPRKGCGWTSATRPTWLSTVTLLLGGTCTCSELPTNRLREVAADRETDTYWQKAMLSVTSLAQAADWIFPYSIRIPQKPY